MKVYERYLAREIYSASLLVLAAFVMLFAFFDLIHEFEDIGKGAYQFRHAVAFVLLSVPGRVYELFPIGVLIGTLYALTLLARHSEITVLRASGLSTRTFVGTLMKLGSVFVVMVFLVGEFVAPTAERAAQQVRLQAMSSVVAQEFRTGLWVKDELSFVNVHEVLPDSRLHLVRIYEFDKDYRLRSLSEAQHGEFLPPDRWRLIDVVQTVFDGDLARVQRLPEAIWFFSNLYSYIQLLAENRQKTDRYEIAIWKKLTYPLAVLVMMVLALPFAYLHDRMGAVSIKVFAGIMLGIGFQLLNGLFANLGVINGWPPLAAAITPSVLFLLAAAAMIGWVERR